ncbi:hypothetical protein P0D72_31260, partial [Paraburkholderia sediminicola]|uniref:hypothetical protein n=1 Tax=Paraburkholderia sediminicola TaxID=458836 RepID=UPI0038BDC3CA
MRDRLVRHSSHPKRPSNRPAPSLIETRSQLWADLLFENKQSMTDMFVIAGHLFSASPSECFATDHLRYLFVFVFMWLGEFSRLM